MSYTHKFEPTERKLREAEALADAIQHNTTNFILAGDCNAQPDSPVIRQLEEHVINCGPEYGQKTWTTKPFSYNGFVANSLDWRLDYVFGSRDIATKSATILPTDFSDHLPILVEIELP